MAAKISVALRNGILQGTSVKEQLDSGFIYIYAGAEPVDADAALDVTNVHTQLAKIAADATPADTGTAGLLFSATASLGALAKAAAQTWAAKVNNVGYDAATNPKTATFFRFVSGPNTAGIPTPIQSASTTSTTGGTLAAGTYYYVITATNAAGETLPSNEVSQVTTGATSSNTINWTAVTGATGYKIFRSTSSGTQAVHYVVGAVVAYLDTNAATTAGSPPVRDNGQAVGTTTTPRIQGVVATAGGEINLTSTSLTDNGTNTVGVSAFEVRMPAA